PGEVVIDELLGLWLALLPFATADWGLMLAAFAFFRVFDIAKPWPVGASENWLPAGYGIMLDDAFAGLWAMLCLGSLHWVGFF
ncbi:MAG: phosphatidylglycerophosphatase A, partial [Desulfovibrionaceae bacterium]|nr:phosphatidylglycerophosphatase A [Desulfovibrionaceae bacterium]